RRAPHAAEALARTDARTAQRGQRRECLVGCAVAVVVGVVADLRHRDLALADEPARAHARARPRARAHAGDGVRAGLTAAHVLVDQEVAVVVDAVAGLERGVRCRARGPPAGGVTGLGAVAGADGIRGRARPRRAVHPLAARAAA